MNTPTTFIIALGALGPIAAATPPSVTAGTAAPFSAPAGAIRTLTIHVAQGADPISPIAGVTANLSPFGGPAAAPFRDDGVPPI